MTVWLAGASRGPSGSSPQDIHTAAESVTATGHLMKRALYLSIIVHPPTLAERVRVAPGILDRSWYTAPGREWHRAGDRPLEDAGAAWLRSM